MCDAICHTCRMLSSDTVVMSQGSVVLHERSETFAVCPPCWNRSSGGPSSASSLDCSSPIRDRSSTDTLRSALHEASTVSKWQFHATLMTSSSWMSNEWRCAAVLRRSHTATVLSAEPVAMRFVLKGLNARQLISAAWPITDCTGFLSATRSSQMRRCLSSPTDPKMLLFSACHATSSTTPACPLYVAIGSTPSLSPPFSTSHTHIVESSDPLKTRPATMVFHESPYPSLSCPVSLRSGRQIPSVLGLSGWALMSKTRTSPEGALVATMFDRCGIHRARLTSPSWLMRFTISTRAPRTRSSGIPPSALPSSGRMHRTTIR
mmetsp:Transcript_35276/g.83540  ORF Transcript_35276/g.83540 Transcript_35276/m.83540 type:complete len:320 (+) Transcript_35276:382-1341(+)